MSSSFESLRRVFSLLHIYMCVKHFGMANIKKKASTNRLPCIRKHAVLAAKHFWSMEGEQSFKWFVLNVTIPDLSFTLFNYIEYHRNYWKNMYW